jgi:hypothetical protein
MDTRTAVVRVLREADEPLHWTVIQDRALRAGYLDPFEIADIRRAVLTALGELVREGAVAKAGTGVYRPIAEGRAEGRAGGRGGNPTDG